MAAKAFYTSAVLSLAIMDWQGIFTSAFALSSRSQLHSPDLTSSVTITTRRRATPGATATTTSSITTTTTIRRTSSSSYSEAMLEDSKGHINPELAQRIWKWEKQQRLNLDLPDFENYSTRAGLRWVKEMIIKTMRSSTMTTTTTATVSPNTQRRSLYDDLIQEGVIGLMTALKTFEQKSHPNESFESFAKAQIGFALETFTLERAKGMGTLTKRHPLSIENTVEINEHEELVDDFLDENLQYEDNIMDGMSPDDLALTDMILYNVDDFLGNTLDETESQIIQMRYGLDDGVPKTQREISFDLDLTVSKIRKLQKLALNKLRANFTARYVSDDTGHEDFWEDTV